jgi:hypothetical protein
MFAEDIYVLSDQKCVFNIDCSLAGAAFTVSTSSFCGAVSVAYLLFPLSGCFTWHHCGSIYMEIILAARLLES